MQTDSVHLSDQAVRAARNCVSSKYGDEYLSPSPRQFKSNARNAQEAHEAIRPAEKYSRFLMRQTYQEEIVASQMAEARLTMVNAEMVLKMDY